MGSVQRRPPERGWAGSPAPLPVGAVLGAELLVRVNAPDDEAEAANKRDVNENANHEPLRAEALRGSNDSVTICGQMGLRRGFSEHGIDPVVFLW